MPAFDNVLTVYAATGADVFTYMDSGARVPVPDPSIRFFADRPPVPGDDVIGLRLFSGSTLVTESAFPDIEGEIAGGAVIQFNNVIARTHPDDPIRFGDPDTGRIPHGNVIGMNTFYAYTQQSDITGRITADVVMPRDTWAALFQDARSLQVFKFKAKFLQAQSFDFTMQVGSAFFFYNSRGNILVPRALAEGGFEPAPVDNPATSVLGGLVGGMVQKWAGDGHTYNFDRNLGVKPFQMALEQQIGAVPYGHKEVRLEHPLPEFHADPLQMPTVTGTVLAGTLWGTLESDEIADDISPDGVVTRVQSRQWITTGDVTISDYVSDDEGNLWDIQGFERLNRRGSLRITAQRNN